VNRQLFLEARFDSYKLVKGGGYFTSVPFNMVHIPVNLLKSAHLLVYDMLLLHVLLECWHTCISF